MEEKERYEIHIYDDVCVDLFNNGVLDKSINNTYKLEDLLNQQDKELSKLRASYQQVKEENSQLKQQLAITEKALELACEPRDDWGGVKYSGTEYDNYYDYFMAEAKEMLGNE